MILFGLGNPGPHYRATRHNAGYLFLEKFAKLHNKRFSTKRGYKRARLFIAQEEILLIKPQCWMNQSGVIVARAVRDYNKEFLVIVDDINLPLGRIRLRSKGSDGGHNGLRSIIEAIGHTNFPRLRLGVGRPNEDIVSYVLTPFTKEERGLLQQVIMQGIRGIEILVKENFMNAQNYINGILIENQDTG
jgi:PTH1 family peptidyl-tRNA hydrolase